ncbi:MAG: VCBS repeat-containing protein [Myxococcales bacterium]|nr:VCBS repeat-containing protein [Myxococcales bacterium]
MSRATATNASRLLAVLLASSPTACVERLIHDRLCGDGRRSPGEVCLGEGERSTLAIDTLTPLSLRTADFDGDSSPDLLVMGLDPSGVVAGLLWRGDGQGDFAPPIDPEVYGCSAHPVPGQIDGDDIDDLLVDDCGPSVSLFGGTPSGVFETPLTVATGATTHSSSLLDLDADGLEEVMLLGSDDAGVAVLSVAERSGESTFAPPVISPLTGLPPGSSPDGFGIFDADGDRLPDALVVAGSAPAGLVVLHGQPGLRFGDGHDVSPPDLVLGWATPRDLDGDGRDEVLAADFEGQALVILALEDERLVEHGRTEVPGLMPGPVALADLDGDGRLDLVRVDAEAAELHAWLRRRGDRFAGFTGPTAIDLDVPADQIALADVDGDGALDVVVGSFDRSILQVLRTDP